MLHPDRSDHLDAAALHTRCRRAGVQLVTIDALIGLGLEAGLGLGPQGQVIYEHMAQEGLGVGMAEDGTLVYVLNKST